MGLRSTYLRYSIVAGRVAGALFHLLGGPPTLAISARGYDSEGMTARQLDLLKEICAHVSLLGGPCVIGGDLT